MPARLAACLCLVLLPAAAPAADPPGGWLDPTLAARFKPGDAFDQEVVVARRSTYKALGADLGTAAKYAFGSRLAVTAVGRDGKLTVSQTVKSAGLLDADPASRAAFEAALKETVGKSFGYTVAPGGGVADFKGPADPVRVQNGADGLANPTVRVWSLLDADGWTELAGLTFFEPAAGGGKWVRPVRHDWGPLGGWAGKTTYSPAGKRGTTDRYDYTHDLTYKSPPAAGDGGPIRLTKAAFKPVAAGGVILFDPARGRVTAAEETFRVRGTATVAVAGGEAAVEMEEEQAFQVRIPDPKTRDLTGRPRR